MKSEKNKRAYFRVYADIPLKTRFVPPEKKESCRWHVIAHDHRHSLNDKVRKRVDISGAGIAFETEEHYTLGDIIEIKMHLKTQRGIIVACGEVVRVDTPHRTRRVALQWISVDEKIRDIITTFVFERERELKAEKRIGWL
ncbi:MAG: PilZ domain-containing protein [Nitrospirota bacterium]